MSTIDTKGAAFLEHERLLELPNDLIGGTQAMRNKGTRYLKKGEAEAQADYELRLHSTHLTDAYTRTLNYLTGQVFSEDVQIKGRDEKKRAKNRYLQ